MANKSKYSFNEVERKLDIIRDDKGAEKVLLGDGTYGESPLTRKLTEVETNLTEEINVERKRINNLASLEEGSTTGDAELMDARVDKAGNVHENAGEHIRNATSQLSSEIDYLCYDNVEIIQPTITNGKYITGYEGMEGQELGDSESCITSLISVLPNTIVKIKNVYLDGNRSVACYGADKVFKSILLKMVQDTTVTVLVPEDAYFIKVTGKKDIIPNVSYASIVSKTFKDLKEDFESTKAEYENSLDRNVAPFTIYNGRYVSAAYGYEGQEIGDENSAVTGLIAVVPNTRIKVLNAYLEDNRSICGYASDKTTFVGVLASHTVETEVFVDIPDNVYNIKVSCKADVPPIIKYIKKDNFIESTYEYVTESGYIKENGLTIEPSTEYKHTNFIQVVGGQYISISALASAFKITIFLYNKDKKLIDSVKVSSVQEYTKYSYHVPIYGRYIRFNTYRSNAVVSYPQELQRNQFAINAFSHLNLKLNDRLVNIFSSACEKPVITMIDDDTWSYNDIVAFKSLCDEMGVKGTYAVQTSRFETDDRIVPLLLSYERLGHSMIYHCYNQSNEADCYHVSTYNHTLVEDDFVHGLQDMHKAGFSNYHYWCTPYGLQKDEQVALCYKWGMKCLISSGWEGNGIEMLDNMKPQKQYHIARNTFSENILDDMKKLALDNVGDNPWILITTHLAKPECQTETFKNALKEFCNYTKELGYEWRTLPEEMERRMPMYKAFETL